MIPFTSPLGAVSGRLIEFGLRALLAPILIGCGLFAQTIANPNLALSPSGRAVTGWSLTPPETELSADSNGLPEGVSSALRVKVAGESPASGALSQRFDIPAGASKLIISGYVRSELPRAGYIEVKLYKGRTELLRTHGEVLSSPSWQKVSIEIDPQAPVTDKAGVVSVADKIEVLCRWYRQSRHIGGQVWFAKIQLTEVGATVAVLGGHTASELGQNGRHGWGRALSDFCRPGVVVKTYAFGSAPDHDERRRTWAACVAARPDYVLLQPEAPPPGESRIAAASAALQADIAAAREHRLPLILVTPPARRSFDQNGRVIPEDADFIGLVLDAGRAASLPVIDLHALSMERLAILGAQDSLALFTSVKDRTSYSRQGASLLAAMVARALSIQRADTIPSLDMAAVGRAL